MGAMVDLECANCEKPFQRAIGGYKWAKKNGQQDFCCSRACSYSLRARGARQYTNKQWLEKQYLELGLSAVAIGEQEQADTTTIIYWLDKHGIPRRDWQEAAHNRYADPEQRQIRADKQAELWQDAEYRSNQIEARADWAERFAGENSPRWRGGAARYYGPNWLKQRNKTRKFDGYRCRECGIRERESGRELDVHHIRPFKEFGYIPEENDRYLEANRVSNLITLCRGCHTRAEAGLVPLQPKLL